MSIEATDPKHVPGGWHRGFNRVYIWGYFAHLSAGAKSVYKILEWRADRFDGFLVKGIGYGGIAKFAGVSDLTVLRAMKTLVALDLIRIIRPHRYSPKGTEPNQPKQYKLLVPEIPFWEKIDFLPDSLRESIKRQLQPCDANLWKQETFGAEKITSRGIRQSLTGDRTVTKSKGGRSHSGAHKGGSPNDTLIKSVAKNNNKNDAAMQLLLLEGFARAEAERLADEHTFERIQDTIENADFLDAANKITTSKTGYIVKALAENYPLLKGVRLARERNNKVVAKVADLVKERQKLGEIEALNQNIQKTIVSLAEYERSALHKEVVDAFVGEEFLRVRLAKADPTKNFHLMGLMYDRYKHKSGSSGAPKTTR